MQYFVTPQMFPATLMQKCDVLHVHSFKSFQFEITSILKMLKNKPFIFTSHGTMIDLSMTGIFKDKANKSIFNNLYDQFLKYFLMNSPDTIIVHSNYEKRLTINYGVKQQKITVIPHAVDVNRFSKPHLTENFLKKYHLSPKNQILLHVGRILRNYRDHHQLIEIFREILKDYPDARILFLGEDFDPKYRRELQRMIKKNDLSQKVLFDFRPTQEDISGAYLASSMFVFPTRHRETFGIPICEAGAAAKTCVAPRICAMPELIQENKTGLLYKLDDTHDLKKKILYLLNNPEINKKMGSKAQEYILANYTWDKVFELNEKVLRKYTK